MRKLIATTSMLALLGAPLYAGGLNEDIKEPEVIAVQNSSSSGGLIVPLLLLALVAVVAASGNGSGGGGGGGLESDRRIKTDVRWVGMKKGLPIYHFRYLGTKPVFEGVMAQDVMGKDPLAVTRRSNGMLAVNYQRLGLQMRRVA